MAGAAVQGTCPCKALVNSKTYLECEDGGFHHSKWCGKDEDRSQRSSRSTGVAAFFRWKAQPGLDQLWTVEFSDRPLQDTTIIDGKTSRSNGKEETSTSDPVSQTQVR